MPIFAGWKYSARELGFISKKEECYFASRILLSDRTYNTRVLCDYQYYPYTKTNLVILSHVVASYVRLVQFLSPTIRVDIMTIEKNELNIVSSPCKYCNDTGSYSVIEQDREGEHYLEQVECGCEFMRRHGIEDTTGEEE